MENLSLTCPIYMLAPVYVKAKNVYNGEAVETTLHMDSDIDVKRSCVNLVKVSAE